MNYRWMNLLFSYWFSCLICVYVLNELYELNKCWFLVFVLVLCANARLYVYKRESKVFLQRKPFQFCILNIYGFIVTHQISKYRIWNIEYSKLFTWIPNCINYILTCIAMYWWRECFYFNIWMQYKFQLLFR